MKMNVGAVLVAMVSLAGCSDTDAGAEAADDYTCEELAEEAHALGESSTGVSLVKARQLEATEGNRTDYSIPTCADTAVILGELRSA